MGRYLYLDNLKSVLIVMMVLVHVSMAYMPYNDFIYVPSNPNDKIDHIIFFMVFGVSYIMHAFFFISGYFFPVSYDRHGGVTFLKKKLLRLGVPLLIVWGYKPLFIDCLWFYHLWYLAVLLCLSVVYWIFRQFGQLRGTSLNSFLLKIVFCCIVLLMGLTTFYLRQVFSYAEHWIPSIEFFRGLSIEPSRFPQYLIMFLLGIISYRFNIISLITTRDGLFCLLLGILTMIFLFCYTGTSIKLFFNSRFYAMFESLFCVSFVIGLIILFREICNKGNDFSKWCSSNSYGAYIFHLLPLIGICVLLDTVAINVYLKFVIASFVSVLGAFALSWVIRMIPGVKKVL